MSDTGSSVPPLSLRPWPIEKTDENATRKFQERLFKERGHFRNITEDGLEEELRKAEQGIAEEDDETEEESGQDYRKRGEELAKAKMEMMAHISQAHNQAMIMRDFLALLVSKDNPKAGALSMSPAMAKEVPAGSLALEKWEMPEPTAAQRENEKMIAQGSRLQSFSSAADRLLSAATRLEKEVRRETKYWGQMLSVKEKGWSIRRIPRVEPTTYGVQVGFAEAGGQFKRRGFIALRTDEDGSVLLDREQAIVPKAIRVRVCNEGKTLGTSRLPLLPSKRSASIEESIRHARDTLFEEELFHEMSLEARILLSYDVRFRDGVIRLPAGSPNKNGHVDREILIDMVELDDASFTGSGPLDELAQGVALSLRLLLCYVHRQRFRRRTELPLPLSNRKQEKPPEAILRPVMTFFRHQGDVTAIKEFCGGLSHVLKSADLAINVNLSNDVQLSDLEKAVAATMKSASSFEKLITVLIRPLKTTITISVPSSTSPDLTQSHLTVEIRTLMYAPAYGTEFTLILPSSVMSLVSTPVKALPGMLPSNSSSNGVSKKLTFTSASDLRSYLSRLIALDLAHNVMGKEHQGWIAGDRTPEISWSTGIDGMKSRKLRVDVEGETGTSVTLTLRGKRVEDQSTGRVEEVVWDGTDGKGAFREAVRKLVDAFKA